MGDRMRQAVRAPVIGEVAATLEEAVDDVRGSGEGEVVVVGKGDRVDEGGEEHVDGVFVGKTQRELGLGADLHENDRGHSVMDGKKKQGSLVYDKKRSEIECNKH